MVAVFFLRLAMGMLAALLPLASQNINPRFYRTHFLTAFGLVGGAAVLWPEQTSPPLWVALSFCLLGAVWWSLADARLTYGTLPIILLATLLPLAFATPAASFSLHTKLSRWAIVADDFSSAAVLGSAVTAMLLGHFYLISQGLSITPLMRLLALLGISLLVRLLVALVGLWQWTGSAGRDTLDNEMLLWLGVRWGVGFLIPLVLTWMAYETARLRSTQSATGILYVVVICCFLGELTALLLLGKTGMAL